MIETVLTGYVEVESAVNTAMVRFVLAVNAAFPEAEWRVETDDLLESYYTTQGYGASWCNATRTDYKGVPIVDSVWDVVWVILGLGDCFEVDINAYFGSDHVFGLYWQEGGYQVDCSKDNVELMELARAFKLDVSPST